MGAGADAECAQLIFAVGQPVPHPLRRLTGYAAPRAVRRRSASGHWFPDSGVIILVPELMGEATRRGDRLDREAIFGAA